MNAGKRRLLGVIVLASLALFLLIPACASNQDVTNPPSSDNKGVDSFPPPFQATPAPERPKDWNPNLDSGLNQLIEAQKRGEADTFAQQAKIDLVNGSVRVTIFCASGQAEAVAKAATEAGAKQLCIRSGNRITAEVPITSLTTIANMDSVTSIELPVQPALPEQ